MPGLLPTQLSSPMLSASTTSDDLRASAPTISPPTRRPGSSSPLFRRATRESLELRFPRSTMLFPPVIVPTDPPSDHRSSPISRTHQDRGPHHLHHLPNSRIQRSRRPSSAPVSCAATDPLSRHVFRQLGLMITQFTRRYSGLPCRTISAAAFSQTALESLIPPPRFWAPFSAS